MQKEEVARFLDTVSSAFDKRKANIRDNCFSFFSDISVRHELFLKTRNELNRVLAHEFNVFNFIGPDEKKLSNIIMFLLDPKGAHGQGAVFLREFLTVIKPKVFSELDITENDLESASVHREYLTRYVGEGRRFIDILVKFIDKNYIIGIENKPFALESEFQVNDYIDYLERKFEDNFIFVFLSGTGYEPVSILEEKRQIVPNISG